MVESNCDAKVTNGIAKVLEKYKDNSTKKEKEYLISLSYNTSHFYGLKMQSKNNKNSMYIKLNHQI